MFWLTVSVITGGGAVVLVTAEVVRKRTSIRTKLWERAYSVACARYDRAMRDEMIRSEIVFLDHELAQMADHDTTLQVTPVL